MWISEVVLDFQTIEAKLWILQTRLLMVLSVTCILVLSLYAMFNAPGKISQPIYFFLGLSVPFLIFVLALSNISLKCFTLQC